MSDPDAKDAYVTVHLDFHHSPPFSFESTDLPIGKDNRLYFKFGKKEGFKVHFTLDDPTYSFGSDKKQALWSTDQSVCPNSECWWEGFKALKIDDGGQTLVVHNKNDSSQDFGYCLRVTNDGGKSYQRLDPIGSNQNSNSSAYSLSTATLVVVAGAALAALAAQFAVPLTTQMPVVTWAIVGALIALASYVLSRGGVARTA